MYKPRTTTVHMDARYFAAIKIIQDRKKQSGYSSPSQNDVFKEGLDELIKKYKIVEEDLLETLREMEKTRGTDGG